MSTLGAACKSPTKQYEIPNKNFVNLIVVQSVELEQGSQTQMALGLN